MKEKDEKVLSKVDETLINVAEELIKETQSSGSTEGKSLKNFKIPKLDSASVKLVKIDVQNKNKDQTKSTEKVVQSKNKDAVKNEKKNTKEVKSVQIKNTDKIKNQDEDINKDWSMRITVQSANVNDKKTNSQNVLAKLIQKGLINTL